MERDRAYRGELATTTRPSLWASYQRTWKKTARAAYLYQHLEPGDALKWQDEEGGQREPLANGILFQTGQDAREPRVFLPRGQRKAKNKKRAWKISLSEPPVTVRQIIGQNECLKVSSQHKSFSFFLFLFKQQFIYVAPVKMVQASVLTCAHIHTNIHWHVQTHIRPTTVLVSTGTTPSQQKMNPDS